MKRILLIVLLFFSFGIFCQQSPYSIERISMSKLSNGMTFIYYYSPNISATSLYLGFNAGSRYDEEGFEGESKLLEKIAFQGTLKIGSKNIAEELKLLKDLEDLDEEIAKRQNNGELDTKEINDLIQKAMLIRSKLKELSIPRSYENVLFSLGAREYYARSTPDFFEIGITFPKESLEKILLLQRDFLTEPSFRSFFDDRFMVFQEGSSLNSEMINPNYEKIQKSFLGEKYELPEKTLKNVKNITLKTFKEYFKKALNPKYGVIVISSNYKFENVLELTEKYFGKIVSDKEEPLSLTSKESDKTFYLETSTENILLAFAKNKNSFEQEAVFDLISSYLTYGDNPIIFSKISDKIDNGSVINGIPGIHPPTLFFININLKKGSESSVEETKVKNFFLNFQNEKLDQNIFEKSKTKLLVRHYSNSERTGNMVRQIGEGYLLSKSPSYFFDYLKFIEKLTPEQVKAVAKTVFIKKGDR